VSPPWLTRIETIGTTVVVLMVGGMMIWYEAVERERRLLVTLASAVLLYVATLVLCAQRSDPERVAWWPFPVAGLVTGVVAGLINARFLITRELFAAAVTGAVIGTAHWAALRTWFLATERPG
jgi:hypothetical protein